MALSTMRQQASTQRYLADTICAGRVVLSVATLSDVVGSANFDVLPGCASGVL